MSLDTEWIDGGCYNCSWETKEEIAEYKREKYADANELLKALNMEPIEVPDYYTEGYQQRKEEAAELRRQQYVLENPPVHTCKTALEAIVDAFYELDFRVSDNTEDQ